MKIISVVHEIHEIEADPTKKHAIIDLSDAGEVGYAYGYTPETTHQARPCVWDTLICTNRLDGRGYWELWDEELDTTGNLVIFTDPLSMNKLHRFEATAKAYGACSVGETLQSLCKYLHTTKQYQEIWVVCSKLMTTPLGQAVATIKKN